MTNAAVLPVPFFARARTSRFVRAIGMASSGWLFEIGISGKSGSATVGRDGGAVGA